MELIVAPSLAGCLERLGGDPVDCVVVDLQLPDAEGPAIVDALAGHSPGLAVVALTGAPGDGAAPVEQLDQLGVEVLAEDELEHGGLARSVRHAILRKRLEGSLAESQRVARVGSWEVDLFGRHVVWSPELARLFGMEPDAIPAFGDFSRHIHPDDRDSTLDAIQVAMTSLEPFDIEHRVLLGDGDVRWVATRGRVELGPDRRPTRLIGTAHDITREKLVDSELAHQTRHDPLTGLPNRLLFLDCLRVAIDRLAARPSVLGLLSFDVDRFKVINDSLGHAAGDQLLEAMSIRLGHLVRPQDTLARIGGDEFVVLCEGLDDEADARTLADRICVALGDPFSWEGGELVVSVSAGVALTDADVSPEDLLQDADAAMYWAKSEGRSRVSVYVQTMRDKAVGRLDTETMLRRSIFDGGMRLFYQPIVDLADGQVLGHEALVRWQHPTQGLLAPDRFITIAEETGLIVPLGEWVVREACAQAKRFQSRSKRWSRLTIAVNLSGGQLGQPDLIEVVASALHEADLRSEYLELEMTESVLMNDAPTTVTVLRRLKGLGVGLAIDDLGTGYSSLAYLRRFPVDVLKIDRTFVAGLGDDLEDSAIVAAVVSLTDTLGLTTIAEGVETALQRDCLLALGCTHAQGYFFARPAPADEAEAALDLVDRDLKATLSGAVDAGQLPFPSAEPEHGARR